MSVSTVWISHTYTYIPSLLVFHHLDHLDFASKVFLRFLSLSVFCFVLFCFFFLATGLIGSYFPTRDHPIPQQKERRVLTTGQPENSLFHIPILGLVLHCLPCSFSLFSFFTVLLKHSFWKSIDLYNVTVLLYIASFLNAVITKVPLSTSWPFSLLLLLIFCFC